MTERHETGATESLTIRQLEVFAMASRSATFSEAAKRLGISQPSLSSTIAKIEAMLGLSLFDRTTRSMTLTREGERLAAMADDLVRDFRATLKGIHDTAKTRRGRLSIAVLPSVASSIAPDALCAFLGSYPDIDIALHDTTQEKGLAWIVDRVVDFGVFAAPDGASELLFDPVYRDEFQVICRRDNPLAEKPTASWKEVSNSPVILTGSGPIRRDVSAAWSRAKVTIKPRFEVDQILTGLALVSAGLGVTVLPSLYLPKVVNEDLRPIRINNLQVSREIGIVRRTDRGLSQPAQELVNCFRKEFRVFDAKHSALDKAVSTKSRSKS